LLPFNSAQYFRGVLVGGRRIDQSVSERGELGETSIFKMKDVSVPVC
jgi:hypothetical protein